MTVYDLPNVTVEEMGSPVRYYRIRTLEDHVIKLPTYDELEYKTVAVLTLNYDLTQVQLLPVSELPEGYEIR